MAPSALVVLMRSSPSGDGALGSVGHGQAFRTPSSLSRSLFEDCHFSEGRSSQEPLSLVSLRTQAQLCATPTLSRSSHQPPTEISPASPDSWGFVAGWAGGAWGGTSSLRLGSRQRPKRAEVSMSLPNPFSNPD